MARGYIITSDSDVRTFNNLASSMRYWRVCDCCGAVDETTQAKAMRAALVQRCEDCEADYQESLKPTLTDRQQDALNMARDMAGA